MALEYSALNWPLLSAFWMGASSISSPVKSTGNDAGLFTETCGKRSSTTLPFPKTALRNRSCSQMNCGFCKSKVCAKPLCVALWSTCPVSDMVSMTVSPAAERAKLGVMKPSSAIPPLLHAEALSNNKESKPLSKRSGAPANAECRVPPRPFQNPSSSHACAWSAV